MQEFILSEIEVKETTNYQRPTLFREIRDTNHEIRYTNYATRIMQNKPNLLNAQMNASSVITKDYENVRLCGCGENKPNQTQFQTFCCGRSYGENYVF